MKSVVTLLVLLPIIVLSQEVDSLTYYQRKAAELRNNMETALRESPEYKAAQEGIKRNLKYSKSYGGFVMFTGLVHNDYDALNKQLQSTGFTKLKAASAIFGLGASAKTDFLVYDLYFMWASSEAIAKRDEEKVQVSMISGIETSWGFPILNKRAFTLYPYFGISMRSVTLEYIKPATVNPNYTSILDIIINDQSARGTSTRLGVQAGIGFDVVSAGSQDGRRVALFVKAGMNKPAWRDRIRIEDIKYEPGIRTNFVVLAGIKFAVAN